MTKHILDAWPHVPAARGTIPSGDDPGNPNGWKDNLNLIQTILNKKLQEPSSGLVTGALLYYDATLTEWIALGPGTQGQSLQVGVDGKPAWGTGGAREESYNFLISDEVRVPSGDTDYIPPMIVSLKSGTATLKKVRCLIKSGTTVTFKIQRNGADVSGFLSLSAAVPVAPAKYGEYTGSISLADGDVLQPVVTAVSGTPKNLTIALVIEYSA